MDLDWRGNGVETSTPSTTPPARPSCAWTRATSGRLKWKRCSATRRKARRQLGWKARDQLRRARARNGGRRIGDLRNAMRSSSAKAFRATSITNEQRLGDFRRRAARPRRLGADCRALAARGYRQLAARSARGARSARPNGCRPVLRRASGRSTCSWRPQRSAASPRTTPTLPISFATTSQIQTQPHRRGVPQRRAQVLLLGLELHLSAACAAAAARGVAC